MRGSWRPNINCNIFTPTLMAVSVVSFFLCWMIAFFTASYQHLLWTPNSVGGPKPLRSGVAFLTTLVYNSVRSLTGTHLTSVLTELYNSSTPTQSPTRSLKSHVWSSSSGNNCHGVHRSLSSCASVYECTMGIFFYLVPFRQTISAQAISSHNCN